MQLLNKGAKAERRYFRSLELSIERGSGLPENRFSLYPGPTPPRSERPSRRKPLLLVYAKERRAAANS
jgi:hypothetical protein